MVKQKRDYICVAAVAILLVLRGASTPALAEGDTVTKVNDHAEQAFAYWTEAAVGAVTPMPLLSKEGVPSLPQSFAAPGPAGAVAGRWPGSMAKRAPIVLDESSAEPKIFGGAQWYSYPPPHTRFFPRFGLTYFPHSTLGKLFFTDGLFNYVCSAAAMTCGNLNLVMTAGHCCAAGNGFTWYDDWLFVPACFGSNCILGGAGAPFGVWDWESVSVPTGWFTSGDFARDVCFLETAPKSGLELHQVTGALGFAWNQTQPIHYTMTGWPAEAPFSGGNLVFELASTAELDGSEIPNTVGAGNFMTGGSSGGAWIKDYTQGTTGLYWNGLNSYKYISPARPAEMFGPYIDTTIFNIWANLGCQ